MLADELTRNEGAFLLTTGAWRTPTTALTRAAGIPADALDREARAGQERYYLDKVAEGAEDYYSGEGEAEGYWLGAPCSM
jgi:hypothetical protein